MTFLISISKVCHQTELLGELMCQELASRNHEKASDKQISCAAACAQRELLQVLPPMHVFKPTVGLMQGRGMRTGQHTIPKW